MRRTLTPLALILRPLIELFRDDFFSPERATLQAIGRATRLSDIRYDIDFYYGKFVESSAARSLFALRLRGSKVRRIAQEIIRKAPATPVAAEMQQDFSV